MNTVIADVMSPARSDRFAGTITVLFVFAMSLAPLLDRPGVEYLGEINDRVVPEIDSVESQSLVE